MLTSISLYCGLNMTLGVKMGNKLLSSVCFSLRNMLSYNISMEHIVRYTTCIICGKLSFTNIFFHMWNPCHYCHDQRLILMQLSVVLFRAIRLQTTLQCLLPSQSSKFLIPLSPIKFTTYDETVTVTPGFIYQFLSHLPLAAAYFKNTENTPKKTLLFIT